ncbi:MAG: ATP-binding protein [Chloroflexota bacterium]|nr:ATP-binding protein [Chloroflexota bacterium]
MSVAYIVLPFLVFIICVFLAALVLNSNWRSHTNRVFAIFLVAMALWGLTIFGMRSSPSPSESDLAYQWEKWVFGAIVATSILFFHFTLLFTRTRFNRWVVRALYVMGAMVWGLSLGGVVVTGMQEKFYGHAPVLGPAFPVYLIVAYVPIVSALVVLARGFRRSRSNDERNRLAYVLLGALASFIGGTTDFLPALGLNIYPLGIVANVVFGVLTTVAVVRYRLLDLRLILRRGFAYSIVSTLIFAVYGVFLLLFLTLFRNQVGSASLIAAIAAIILGAILIPPAVGRVQSFFDRLFLRERYDYLVALQSFAFEARDIRDFAGLAQSLTRTVTLAMQAEWVAIMLPQAESGDLVVAGVGTGAKVPDVSFGHNSPVAKWLTRTDGGLAVRELDLNPYLQALGDTQRQALKDSGAQLLVPMKSKGVLTGILMLGPKLVGNDYSGEDVRLVATVANQAATLVENSRLYSQELARLQQLEQLQVLKSNLLRTVSHEIKSPVTAIKTAVELISGPQEIMDGRQRERLTRVLRSGVERLERLVQESLDYAQMQSAQLQLRLEPTDLERVVRAAMELVDPSARTKRQTMTIEVAPDLPKLVVDPQRIERVVLNLLSNASKFTQAGGQITVRVAKQDSIVLTEVSDNGPGIPEEDQKFMFREFYRGRYADGQKNAGTGLGLSIAKYLVEMHGGKIWLNSKQGEGATFSFTLPIVSVLKQDAENAGAAPPLNSA